MEKLKHYYRSHRARHLAIVLLIVVALLIAFHAGMDVGERRAAFESHFAGDYARVYGDRRHGFILPVLPHPMGFGAAGTVVSVGKDNFVLETTDNTERTVVLSNDTLVRLYRNPATSTDIRVRDQAIVLGNPDDKGEIVARFVRIVPAASSTPTHQ